MKAITIMYHDVVGKDAWDESGFPGGSAALYKLERDRFAAHLDALCHAAVVPTRVSELPVEAQSTRTPLLLSFDDGGVSAYSMVADMLEERGWRGHFMIATNYIGTRAFLEPEQIRQLRRRGHVIGSHSATHPLRMAQCNADELFHEWSSSVQALSDLLGEQVTVASVPGGHYARQVAQSAAQAGIKTLFTSEPQTGGHEVDGCMVLGRYTIQRWMSPAMAVGFAREKALPCLRQKISWNAKKIAKALGGQCYMKMRAKLLGDKTTTEERASIVAP
jgi:peptidoglycan/xylan/chitin deacetylase (PgdA/CDA1 family)